MPDISVKSARRVFEFLELFSRLRRPLSVAELAHHFSYPASSVSAILRTQVSMGYLTYNASTRKYLTSPRLSFLVGWIGSVVYREERIRALMQELGTLTDATIVLGMQVGLRAQYVHVVEAVRPVQPQASAGDFRPLLRSAVGHALLSRLATPTMRRLVTRLNAEEPAIDRRVDVGRIHSAISRVREVGYAFTLHGVVPGAGAMAALLPETIDGQAVAVGIGASESSLLRHRKRLAASLLGAIGRHYPAARRIEPSGTPLTGAKFVERT